MWSERNCHKTSGDDTRKFSQNTSGDTNLVFHLPSKVELSNKLNRA